MRYHGIKQRKKIGIHSKNCTWKCILIYFYSNFSIIFFSSLMPWTCIGFRRLQIIFSTFVQSLSFFCVFFSFHSVLLLRKCFMFHPKSFDFTKFSVFSDVIKWSTNAVNLFAGKNEILLQENSLKLTIESCAFEVFTKSLESQLYTQVVSTFKIMFSEHK